jgi:hypothetical protein
VSQPNVPLAGSDADECPGLLAELRILGAVGQAWTIGVVLLCLGRAVVVWPMLDHYGVNPWWFLVLDVGTAPAYGIGQAMGVKILRDDAREPRHALPWIAMVLVSFLAPYLYVLRSAGHLPGYVVGGVLAWMAVFGAVAAWRMAREVKQCTDLVAEPVAV